MRIVCCFGHEDKRDGCSRCVRPADRVIPRREDRIRGSSIVAHESPQITEPSTGEIEPEGALCIQQIDLCRRRDRHRRDGVESRIGTQRIERREP